jgi:hypothetical protein
LFVCLFGGVSKSSQPHSPDYYGNDYGTAAIAIATASPALWCIFILIVVAGVLAASVPHKIGSRHPLHRTISAADTLLN